MVTGDMFREGMARLGAAVTVVTTDGPAGRRGLTVSAVCSVTDSPPSLMVCINRRSRSHGAVLENGVLCVNVLAGSDEPLGAAFAGRGEPGDDPFLGADWGVLATGAPALASAVVALDCRISLARDIGTHSAILCEVQAMSLGAGSDALVYFNRRFHHLHWQASA
ncbi:MAG TPA: flavin reductase [Phenylobacterium sp.]|uniref:flavin reductase n=1 Tax=Phenylobacterium sp. TaxID=1871053 RepID=UPI002B45CB2F|nr:flavin reductase [Phenylobacterium sp.]HKR87102.1 flavin reductase [Phenylobacterium sp.]